MSRLQAAEEVGAAIVVVLHQAHSVFERLVSASQPFLSVSWEVAILEEAWW